MAHSSASSLRRIVASSLLFFLTLTPSAFADDLFNGKNLDGWRYYLSSHAVGLEDVWSVQDGLLVCKGEPIGYLYTKSAYKNFRLKVEWRWPPGKEPGNSGVLMRINGKPQPLPRCYEAQLKSGSAGDVYGFHNAKISGDQSRIRTVKAHEIGGDFTGFTKTAAKENAPGQWNTYEIEVQGSTIKISVNGTPVNEASDLEVISGPIGLQSEGGEIHFRTVQITPLAD